MEELDSSNVNEFCRLCLGKDAAIPVFPEESGTGTSLSKRILECVSVEINEGDKLPSAVCKDCLENVNSWYNFKDTCDKTQRKLHLWLENQHSSQEGTKEGAENDAAAETMPILARLLCGKEDMPLSPSADAPPVPCEMAPSSEVIDIESNGQNTEGKIESDDSKSANNTESVVGIKIESTHSLSMDIFNNYDLIENNQTITEGRDQPVNENNLTDKIDSIGDVTDVEFVESTQGNKRKRESSLSDDLQPSVRIPRTEEITSVVNITAEDPLAPEEVALENKNSSAADQSDNSSVAEIPLESNIPLAEKQVSQPILVCNVKQEPIDIEEPECENLNFPDVSVKTEIPDTGTEYEEESVNESINLQEENDVEIFACETCNKTYRHRSHLLRHFGCKSHKRLVSGLEASSENDPNDQSTNVSEDLSFEDSRAKLPRRCKSNGSIDSDSEKPKIQQHERSFERRDVNPHLNYSLPLRTSVRRREDFKCSPCNNYYKSNSDLERHFLSIKHQTALAKQNSLIDNTYSSDSHPAGRSSIEDDKIFACPVETCDLTFSSGLLLISHMKRHGIISNMSKELVSSNFVNPPPRVVQPSVKYYNCHKCGLKFSTPIGKSNHIRTCKGVKHLPKKIPVLDDIQTTTDIFGRKFCPVCNLHIADELTLISHIETYHKGYPFHQSLGIGKQSQLVKQNITVSKSTKSGLYKCKMCPASFNFMHALRLHVKRHMMDTQIKHFVCKVCKKVFSQIKRFRIHLRKHFLPDGSKKLLCITCYQVFDNRSELSKHRKNGKCQIKIKIYSCNICSHSYNKLSSLEEHKAMFHGNSPITETIDERFSTEDAASAEEVGCFCEICNKSYSSRGNYKRHLKLHEMADGTVNKYNCTICHSDFPNAIHLEMHKKICSPENELTENMPPMNDIIQCKYCNKTFLAQKSLKGHLLSNCPVFVRKYKKCLKCGKYVPQRLLNRDWSCKLCSKVPINRQPQRASAEKAVLFQCPLGQKQFMSRSSMINHYSSCNGNCTNTAAFFCKACKERYADINSYNEHKGYCQRIVSEPLAKKQGSYPCSYCSKTFTRSYTRTSHEARCSGNLSKTDNPTLAVESTLPSFVPTCDVCNATFRTMKLLSLHKKKYRKQCSKLGVFSRRYSCQFCSNTNLFQSQLYKHTGYCIKKLLKINYQVACQTCNQKFASNEPPKEFYSKVQCHIIECLKVPYHPDEVLGPDGTKVLCLLCGFCFPSSESLRKHSSIVHYKTKHTSSSSTSDDKISGETSSIADVEPPLNEPENVTLNMKEEVEEHEKNEVSPPVVLHEGGEMPVQHNYKCPYCVKSFRLLRNLVFHKSTKHLGNKASKFLRNVSLKCKVCNRQFLSLAKLKNHEKVHGIVRENVFGELEIKHSEEEPAVVEENVINLETNNCSDD